MGCWGLALWLLISVSRLGLPPGSQIRMDNLGLTPQGSPSSSLYPKTIASPCPKAKLRTGGGGRAAPGAGI